MEILRVQRYLLPAIKSFDEDGNRHFMQTLSQRSFLSGMRMGFTHSTEADCFYKMVVM